MKSPKVNILIKGNKDDPEYIHAEKLKQIFETEFSTEKGKEASGNITILVSVQLFGETPRDIDLIVYADLRNYSCQIGFFSDSVRLVQKVSIQSFCVCIEVKGHTASRVRTKSGAVEVKYKESWKSATTQNEGQKYSLLNFLRKRRVKYCHISNFIWLSNISNTSIKELVDEDDFPKQHNIMGDEVTARWFFYLLAAQNKVDEYKGEYTISAAKDKMHNLPIHKALTFFSDIRQSLGELTRRRLEIITQKALKGQKFAEAIDEKLLILKGRAGTGKTMRMVRVAFDLATNNNKRCLILTYNKLLVSDIKRLIALSGMPDDIDSHTVRIETLHSFFYEILIGFNFCRKVPNNKGKKGFMVDGFIQQYLSKLEELREYLDTNTITPDDIDSFIKNNINQFGWDNIFIDEAQDWQFVERDILYSIFGSHRIIVADGVDQMIRSKERCKWDPPQILTHKKTERKSLRQKRNLVTFENAFAEEFNLNWSVEVNKELTGGQIIISTQLLNYELFSREYELCQKNGNKPYEFLFMAPPNQIIKNTEPNEYGEHENQFKHIHAFRENGFPLWDGSSKSIRNTFPTNPSEFRLIPYDSCRGLEGWTAVCLGLDDLVEYKLNDYEDVALQQSLLLEDSEERKNRHIYTWSLIPLTRSIDTTIITLNNVNSDFSQRLKRVSENFDFIEWI